MWLAPVEAFVDEVWIVMERTGTPSRLVRRRLASAEALALAERRARWRGPSGSSRFIVFEGSADWMW